MSDFGSAFRIRRAMLLAAGAALIAGCSDDGEGDSEGAGEARPSLLALLESGDEVGFFMRSLSQADFESDLDSELEAGGPYTLFVPIDDAAAEWWGAIRDREFDWYFEDGYFNRKTLENHIVRGQQRRADLPLSALPTLAGGTLEIDADLAVTDGQGRTARIVGSEQLGRNGVIHFVDGILLPATPPPRGPLAALLTQPQFSILAALVHLKVFNTEFGFLDDAPYTFFAPTNAAFESYFAAQGTTAAAYLERSRHPLDPIDLLYRHAVAGLLTSADVIDGFPVATEGEGGFVKIERDGASLVIHGEAGSTARVTTADLQDGAGVVHVVDQVLPFFGYDALDLLARTEGFSIAGEVVRAYLTESGSDDIDDGPFIYLDAGTVFAPTDAAFALYFAERGITEAVFLAELESDDGPDLRILLVRPTQLFAQLTTGQPVTTKAGTALSIDASGVVTDPLGREAHIVRRDWLHSEGVIHVVDRVLLSG